MSHTEREGEDESCIDACLFRIISWQSFVRYLQEQVFDLKQMQDRSSPIYSQVRLSGRSKAKKFSVSFFCMKYVPSRVQWVEDLQREFHEKDRLRVIDRFIANNQGVRVVNHSREKARHWTHV